MAYAPDRDRATRGVGAIAARDYGNLRARVQRLRQARFLRDRDRELRQWTYGPNGGMGVDVEATTVPAYDPRVTTPPPFVKPGPTTSSVPVRPTVDQPVFTATTATPASTKPNLLMVGGIVLAAILLTRKSS